MAIASLALAAQDGVLLRRELKENTTEVYKVETMTQQTMSLPTGMEQEFKISALSTYTVKTGKIDPAKGTAAVEVINQIDKVDADGMMASMMGKQDNKPIKFSAVMDNRGRLVMDTTKALDPQAMMMAGAQAAGNSGMFVELPEKAVKIGDTWDVVIPKSPMLGKTDQKLVAKLAREDKLNGKDVYVVAVNGTLNIEIDPSQMAPASGAGSNPMAGQKMTVKGTVTVSGEGFVEKATGKTLKMESVAKTKSKVEMPDMGLSIDGTGTVTTKVALQ